MSLFAVWGYDDLYGGEHDMKEVRIIEGTSENAKEWAKQLAIDVVDSYDCITEDIEESVIDECEWQNIDPDSDEADDIRNRIYDEDLVYGYVALDENKLPKDKNFDELEDELFEDIEAFVKKYRIN